VPVLAADARRIEEARRCRADGGGEGAAARVAVLRAVAGGALDRALDVAATLEVRGYGGARRGAAGRGLPWSRHDRAFLVSAMAVVALTIASRAVPWAGFGTYPQLHATGGGAATAAALALAYAIAALLPFADRRGIAG
jgi:energy-coupling factor transport system permease protein